ncbi:asparagine-linked glycosylation 10 [Halteromyces radiatus]|uniref:asparagine-linked glycosylation 10 n=1 Tax=Halteromyces radiatus TaxID=101107 RepID=UPI002220ECE2|nr:asparagine-linked glycosylation 10 [Halteromyces radiatus]KAI8079750.1 asparagine-linked glycosylation 10 [Halteromyces radiatus]
MPGSLLAHTVALAIVAQLVNHLVPDSYMDEIFHIPQAQQYCQGDYVTWNPKLTTPPGLYIISLGLKGIGDIFHLQNLCSIQGLRATNLIFAFLLYFVLNSLLFQLHPTTSSFHRSLYALILSWFPVSFFYYFLYYTDTGSTLFVLLSYLSVKTENYLLAGLMSAVAVGFRQTNIVWTFFFMVLSIIQLVPSTTSNTPSTSLYNPIYSNIDSVFNSLFKSILSLLLLTLKNILSIVPRLLTFLATLIGFCAFLVHNGGIVLGDKSNHLAGLHFPQLFYYISFSSFFGAPFLLTWSRVMSCINIVIGWNTKSFLFGLSSLTIMVYLIRHYTYEHPFLLSDNRHYTFYVWKRIYRRHWMVRYALVPFYAICMKFKMMILGSHVSLLWMLGYMMTLLLTLVPSPLLEFRYFILPFLFFSLHLPPPSTPLAILSTLVFYVCINVATLYIFLYRPFIWPQNPGEWQRFMW